MKRGDFTNLASDYTKYRPSYNASVVELILSAVKNDTVAIKAADVGAGTGIFTKCLLDAGVKEITAVEPNDDMRKAGADFLGESFPFLSGSAEQTGLQASAFDLVTMASSFHWPQTDQALKEFDRILSPDGVFCALWNPRLTERSTVENKVQKLLEDKYGVASRVSSGLSGITSELRDILGGSGFFRSVVYLDAIDVVQRTSEEYIGAWRSVNDVQAQLGQSGFASFLTDVEEIVSKHSYVEVHYLTRAWIARK